MTLPAKNQNVCVGVEGWRIHSNITKAKIPELVDGTLEKNKGHSKLYSAIRSVLHMCPYNLLSFHLPLLHSAELSMS